MAKYVIRLDDACPWYDKERWRRCESILHKYNIRPLVGVIPAYEGEMKLQHEEDKDFWNIVKTWQRKGWAIALHGYNHRYRTRSGGINPINKRSEYAGVPLEDQIGMIKGGMKVFEENGIKADSFFAPAHTYDDNTVQAVMNATDIRNISDSIAFDVYCENGMVFVPLVPGRQLPGAKVITMCYHPTLMDDEKQWAAFESFIQGHLESIVDYQTVCKTDRKLSLLEKVIRKMYFILRG